MAVESVFPPIPSEVVLPLAGSQVAAGQLSFLVAVLAATAGSVLGAWALYALGRFGGRPALLRLLPLLRIDEQRLARAEAWFARHGDWLVLLGRLVPGLRALVSVPAGMGRMPPLALPGADGDRFAGVERRPDRGRQRAGRPLDRGRGRRLPRLDRPAGGHCSHAAGDVVVAPEADPSAHAVTGARLTTGDHRDPARAPRRSPRRTTPARVRSDPATATDVNLKRVPPGLGPQRWQVPGRRAWPPSQKSRRSCGPGRPSYGQCPRQ